MSSSNQSRSVPGAGTSESASTGCSLSERLRPNTNNTGFKGRSGANSLSREMDGLLVFTWGKFGKKIRQYDLRLYLMFVF
jgi:hypothetical protein